MCKLLVVFIFAASGLLYAQTILEANGPGDTYELIESVFAPAGGEAVESPDCIHTEFGRHICEVWDKDINQFVFEFFLHLTPDNDRCIKTDRQRIEIKTQNTPDSLVARSGKTITFRWKFKLPTGFQPSSNFTHLHQIKAVGGNDGSPIFTLSPRKGSPNKMVLLHNNEELIASVNLSLFEGTWVECTEIIKVGNTKGAYSIIINKINDGMVILSYSNNDIMTIRKDNNFVRPKWGIVRSLKTPSDLRDETVRFAGFIIQ